MVTHSTERTLRKSFFVDPPRLIALASLFREFASEISIRVRLSDDDVIRFERIDEALSTANTRSRRIIGLSLYTWHEEKAEIMVRFWGRPGRASVSYEIKGSTANVDYIRAEIIRILDGTDFWYSRYMDLSFTKFALIFGALWMVSFCLYIPFVPNPTRVAAWLAARYGNTVPWLFACLLQYAWLIAILTGKVLFPDHEFLIGDGLRRAQATATRRSVFFVTIGLGLAIGVLGNLLWTALTK